jgi:hypothetical protein
MVTTSEWRYATWASGLSTLRNGAQTFSWMPF